MKKKPNQRVFNFSCPICKKTNLVYFPIKRQMYISNTTFTCGLAIHVVCQCGASFKHVVVEFYTPSNKTI